MNRTKSWWWCAASQSATSAPKCISRCQQNRPTQSSSDCGNIVPLCARWLIHLLSSFWRSKIVSVLRHIVVASTRHTILQHEISSLLMKYSEDLWPAVILAGDGGDGVDVIGMTKRWDKIQNDTIAAYIHVLSEFYYFLKDVRCACVYFFVRIKFSTSERVCWRSFRSSSCGQEYLASKPKMLVSNGWVRRLTAKVRQLKTIMKLFCDRPTKWWRK